MHTPNSHRPDRNVWGLRANGLPRKATWFTAVCALIGVLSGCSPAPPLATNASELAFLEGTPERRLVALPTDIPETWAIHWPTEINRSPINNEIVTIRTIFGPATLTEDSGEQALLCVESASYEGECDPTDEQVSEWDASCLRDGGTVEKCTHFGSAIRVETVPEIPGLTAYFMFINTDDEIKDFFAGQALTTDWNDLPWMERELFIHEP